MISHLTKRDMPQLVIINDTEKRRKVAFREARCSYETTLYNKGMKTMSIPSVKEYIRTQQLNWERKNGSVWRPKRLVPSSSLIW